MMNRADEAATAKTNPRLSLIIPVLNEERSIGDTLDAVANLKGPLEVIVVDGGSRDRTIDLARERGVRVIEGTTRGRGAQMHAGARAARGEIFLFLHGDTIPPPDAAERIDEALSDPAIVGGNFRVIFGGASRAARFLTWLYPWLGSFGLRYGDSGLFVRRKNYHSIGGFKPFPIFEDLDFLRRLKRAGGRLAHVRSPVVTSSRRFEKRSFALTFARWSALQILYWLGLHPDRLGRIYYPDSRPGRTRVKGESISRN